MYDINPNNHTTPTQLNMLTMKILESSHPLPPFGEVMRGNSGQFVPPNQFLISMQAAKCIQLFLIHISQIFTIKLVSNASIAS